MVKISHSYHVQSKVSKGKILSINTAAALEIPGVVGWVDCKDVPGRNLYGLNFIPDDEVFPTDCVDYVGHIIGLIAAETAEAGQAGVDAVVVEVEEMKPVLTLADAVNNEPGQNRSIVMKKDNLENNRVVEVAPRNNVKGTVTLGGQEHYYFEPHTCLVVASREKSEVTVFFSTQEPSSVQVQLAAVLNLPQHSIIVKCKRAGNTDL